MSSTLIRPIKYLLKAVFLVFANRTPLAVPIVSMAKCFASTKAFRLYAKQIPLMQQWPHYPHLYQSQSLSLVELVSGAPWNKTKYFNAVRSV